MTPFQRVAYRLFGHESHQHRLTTPRARLHKAGAALGSRVQFEYKGAVLEGVLNRVTRRATVLVESPEGTLYTDGARYVKYYVPVECLTAV